LEKDRPKHLILEQAILKVKPGQQAKFEAAMREAMPLIAASPGFQGIEVRPAAESPGTYLLLVKWETIAAHREGFRRSERYQKWKALLHHFYDPMPLVTYFGEALPGK
jgi:heme-degrading monooxygenase HmoA